MRRLAGSTLAILLLSLALILVFLTAVVAVGARHSQLVQAQAGSSACVQAAEAGIHRALDRLARDPGWSTDLPEESLGGSWGQRVNVQVTNNRAGVAPVPSPDGVEVPPGRIYLRSTGTCRLPGLSRAVAVMLARPVSFPYALASGGPLTLRASGTVFGNIKSSQALSVEANIQVEPVEGQGRVLVSEDLDISGGLVSQAEQDVRARGQIRGQAKIKGTTLVYPQDTSPDTQPFLMNGSLTPEGAPVGQEVMPNPDPEELLPAGGYVEHPGPVTYGGKGRSLDLQGEIHYFPDGVRFAPGSQLLGSGTIVVGNGRSAVFDIPLNHDLDVIVLDGHQGTVGGGEIRFNSSTRIRGLVFCHGSVYAAGSFQVEGRVITYGAGESIYSGANLRVDLEPGAVSCPGFGAFFGEGLILGGLQVLSWQRL